MPEQSKDGALPQDLIRQIATRLRPVVPDIPEDEFNRLVEDVARVKLKYDGDEIGQKAAWRTAGGRG